MRFQQQLLVMTVSGMGVGLAAVAVADGSMPDLKTVFSAGNSGASQNLAEATVYPIPPDRAFSILIGIPVTRIAGQRRPDEPDIVVTAPNSQEISWTARFAGEQIGTFTVKLSSVGQGATRVSPQLMLSATGILREAGVVETARIAAVEKFVRIACSQYIDAFLRGNRAPDNRAMEAVVKANFSAQEFVEVQASVEAVGQVLEARLKPPEASAGLYGESSGAAPPPLSPARAAARLEAQTRAAMAAAARPSDPAIGINPNP